MFKHSEKLKAITWNAILHKCKTATTKMLLSRQAELRCIALNEVVIALSPNWEEMIEDRREIIEEAVREVLGDKKNVTFIVKEK